MNAMPPPQPVLEVERLSTVFDLRAGTVRSVNDISFSLKRGEILGIVGESGSGKSVTGLSVLGLIEPPGRIAAGSIRLEGRELTTLGDAEKRKLRGNAISMIFQDPMTTLNPVLSIGRQFFEVINAHRTVSFATALDEAEAALVQVGIPAARERLSSYPHELSGGMRQRVCIAMSLINKPAVVIADEPTTALDVTIQAQILNMMQNLVQDSDVSLIWVTHDLSVVAGLCDRVAVMYAGRIVETGPVEDVLRNPRHPYTRGLLDSIPGDAEPGRRLRQVPGTQPSPLDLPHGCSFRPRCSQARDECKEEPASDQVGPDHFVRCLFKLGGN